MSELIKEIYQYYHYDKCLHGCDRGWAGWKEGGCTCPIGKPHIAKTSVVERSLFEAYGVPYNPDGMPREKVLEIINEWNNHGAHESVKGYTYGQSKAPDYKIETITEQYPIRWVYFIDSPQWLKDAQKEHHDKFTVRYEANKVRETEELKLYGTAMDWIYHEQLEDFIVPIDLCPKGPHYADQIPKDAPTEHEAGGWGDEIWICPNCNQQFKLTSGWKNWKRRAE